jgi:serine/threonine-protein kinase
MGAPQPADRPQRFGKYTLVATIARGGMAEILLAMQQGPAGFEKLVCIKRILPSLAEDHQFVSMFLDEARTAARISHPNVCQVYDLGEVDGSYYMAMEYLQGVPLACLRRKDMYRSPPDPGLVVGIAAQMCEGLHHAHELTGPDGRSLEVVHRDVSGQNVFVTIDGIAKVLDFGIARVQDASIRTTTGAVKGTYAYMAPEQLRNQALDRRTDVFAAGIVVWEALAQRHLFRRDTDFLTFEAITTNPIPDVCTYRPDVPPEIGAAIAKALARDRDDRFPTARAFGEALTRAVMPLGGPAMPPRISEEIRRAFERQLAEQRALIALAREGAMLDLDQEQRPALAHGTELMTTPASNLRSQAASPPAAPPPASSVSEVSEVSLRPRIRWPIVAGIALVTGALGVAAFVALQRDEPAARREAAAPIAAAPAPVDAAADPAPSAIRAVVRAVDAAPEPPAIAAVPPDASVALPPPEVPLRKVTPPRASTGPGTITIDSKPYAVIFIDGKRLGETPLIDLSLPAGAHELRAVSPTGEVRRARIVIESRKAAPPHRIVW